MSFLRALFGPGKDEIWRELAQELGGEFYEGGLFSGPSAVAARYKEWTVTFDTYSTGGKNSKTYTRIRAPFCNAEELRFEIYRSHIFSGIGALLGAQDIEIGDRYFDDEFIIKSNIPSMVKKFFANDRLKEFIHVQPNIRFSIRDDQGWFAEKLPQGVDELVFCRLGIMRNLDELHDAYSLFAEALNQLCHIGAAYEDDPRF